MENRLFMCECEGCFDGAVADIKSEYLGEVEEFQICDSCIEYFKSHNDIKIISIDRFDLAV